MMLISQFIMGLRDEIQHHVELMLLESIFKAAILASLHEHLLSSTRKLAKYSSSKGSYPSFKSDTKATSSTTVIWQARQWKEYHRVNGLCYRCGEKYTPGHKCSITIVGVPNAQVAVMTTELSEGRGLLSDEILNLLEAADLTSRDPESYLSLHALVGT
jgi:hypothetical protein